MKLFDTHFHIDENTDFEQYINDAKKTGVKYFNACGSTFETSLLAKEFSTFDKNAYFAAGCHPHDADYIQDASEFEMFYKEKKCIAVGEIGLDYFYGYSDSKQQRLIFGDFLDLALTWSKPAIIHCRDKENSDKAYEEAYCILEDFAKSGGRFVIHCYTGSLEWLNKFLELGAYIGITGIVTFPKAQNVRDCLYEIPLDRLFLETDAPYLAPVPFRGQTNSSSYLVNVADKVAKEKDSYTDEIAKITTKNAMKFFKIKKK